MAGAHVTDAAKLIRMIYLYQSAGTEVRGCQLDHFIDKGIEVKSSDYVTIEGNVIERGASLVGPGALLGIDVEECAPTILDNTIFDTRNVGIKIVNAAAPNKWSCVAAPWSPESLLVVGNHVEAGPNSAQTGAIGLDMTWVCEYSHAQVTENFIEQWSGVGIKMKQVVDAKVQCNTVQSCTAAFDYERSDMLDKPPVRLKGNYFLNCGPEEDLLRTTNGKKLKLGPGYIQYTGRNLLDIPTDDEWFVRQDDDVDEAAHELDGLSTFWTIGGLDVTTKSEVLAEIHGDSPRDEPVVVDDPPASASSWMTWCHPGDPTPGTSGRQPRPPESAVAGETNGATAADEVVAVVPGLGHIGPVPTTAGIRFALGVEPPGEDVRVTVYDLAGRRVRQIMDGRLPGGAHQLVWDGRNDERHSVGPGVFFLRVERGASVEVRKIVRVR